jgi:uncharacterized protein YjdB/uncharacterized Zn finger protein (UPF0148 family)
MTHSSKCPNCGEPLYRDDAHCPKCGSRRSELVLGSSQLRGATRALAATSAAGDGEIPTCSSCGAPRHAGDTFCTTCGNPAEQGSPAPAREPAPSPPPQTPQTLAPPGDMDGWLEVRHQLEEATRGEFEVIKELGRGGMAAVFLAQDMALGRKVAIKVMAPGLLLGQGMVDRFRQEAVTIANLHHPNIITIHTVRQAGSLHFFVMQVVDGGSLEGVLERPEPLPVALVQTILYQLGTGLAHAHRQGVIHRDIKPANVLLDAEGNAILTDFGIAKVTTASNLTQTGSTIGTPAYMSPEQCRAAELSSASDQYSLGVVAYEMLVGEAPFAGSPFEIMQAHTSSTPPEICERRQDCPPELEAAIQKMMAKDPAERFPSVAEAIEAIGGYLPGPGDPLRHELVRLVRPDAPEPTAGRTPLTPIPAKTPLPIPGLGAAGPTRRRIRLPLLIGGGLGLAAIITVAVVYYPFSSPDEADPGTQETLSVSTITFPNASESLLVGATVRVQARVEDSAGLAMADEPVNWSSEDPMVATVEGFNEEVEVTGVAAGTAVIQANIGGVSAAFTVLVSAPAVGQLTVTSPRRALQFGEAVTLAAVLTDDNGQRVPDPDLAWSSSDSRVVEVDPVTGVASARGLGRAQVTANAGDRTGTVSLSVVGRVDAVTLDPPTDLLEAGGTTVVRATVTSEPAGYSGEGGISWSSSNPSVASVSAFGADSVVLTLLAEGESILTARAGSIQSAVTLRVAAPTSPVTVSLSVPSVSFEAVEGGDDPVEQTIGVSVTGDGTPSVGVVQYEGGGGDWLQAGLGARTGERTALTLRADVGGLAEGTYVASVPISAGGNTQVLEARITVAANPAAGPVEPNEEAERGITVLLAEYASAINAKNAERVRELFPSLPQDGVADLLDNLRETDTILLQMVPGSLKLGPEEGTLEGDVMSSVLGGGNRGEAYRMIYTFGRGDQGWYLVSQRQGG